MAKYEMLKGLSTTDNEYIAAKVKEAEKLGFGIIQISIDAVYGVKDMFDTYIDIGYNLEEMPKLLNEIVKTKVIKTKHTTVS